MATAQGRRTPDDTAQPGRLTLRPEAVPTARAEPGDPDGSLDPVKAGGRKPTWVALVPAALAAVTSPRVLCGGGWTYVRPKMSRTAIVKPGKATRVIGARVIRPKSM